MPPPPPAAPTKLTTTTTTATAAAAAAVAVSATPSAVTTSQLSAILDPFFSDTCHFLKQAPWVQQQPRAAATAAAPADSYHNRIDASFLSGAGLGGEPGFSSSVGGGGVALDDWLASPTWAASVKDMEAEKNDMLRLDVSVALS